MGSAMGVIGVREKRALPLQRPHGADAWMGRRLRRVYDTVVRPVPRCEDCHLPKRQYRDRETGLRLCRDCREARAEAFERAEFLRCVAALRRVNRDRPELGDYMVRLAVAQEGRDPETGEFIGEGDGMAVVVEMLQHSDGSGVVE